VRVSLVVATMGRIEPLKKLLNSLQEQRHQDFRIWLADQNPPGFLDEALAEFAHLPITRMRMPPCGPSVARNRLLAQAAGDVVAFPDDDCFYATDTLDKALGFFSRNPEYGAVLARWSEPETAPGRPEASDTKVQQVTRRSAFWRGPTFVHFYRHQAVRTVGDFDETLGPGSGTPWGCGEDTDYLLRVMEAGFPVARVNAIRVYHPAPDMTDPALSRKGYSYGLGRMRVLKKHGFSMPFRLANVVYPLLRLPWELPRHGWGAVRYRMAMFLSRFTGLRL
jgi:glycosyltransferase involved in cell wall biosynthesis